MDPIIRTIYLLLISFFFFFSCEENAIGIEEGLGSNSEPSEIVASKKGVAFTNRAEAWSHKTSQMKAHWMYSWGNILRDEIPENVEFVPMFWGRSSVSDANIERVKGLVAEGKVKYILGFNEPDERTQANMSVDEAIELWPRLEEIGVPIGSPATVHPDNDWMVEFMRRADEEGLRVDFITVHHYGGLSVPNFISKLGRTYRAYGERPLWITEFAVADWSANSRSSNRNSPTEVIDFMNEVLPALDEIDFVERYAWFSATNPALFTSALFDDDNQVTEVGTFYANHSPNEDIGPGVDTEFEPEVDPDELVQNPGFETGSVAPWGGYKNGVIANGGNVAPFEGNFSGRVENGDGSFFTIVNVEAGKTYTLSYYSKWADNPPNAAFPVIRNNNGNEILFRTDGTPVSTEWEQTTYEFTVPEGVTELKVVFWKANGFPPFFLDNVSIKLNENL